MTDDIVPRMQLLYLFFPIIAPIPVTPALGDADLSNFLERLPSLPSIITLIYVYG